MARKRMEVSRAEEPSRAARPRWHAPLLLVLLGFGVYAVSLPAPFHLDDWGSIVNEPGVKQLWPVGGHPQRPVLMASLALNYAVFGMEPYGFRLVNIAIHVVATLFLYGALRRIASSGRFAIRAATADGFALTAAAIWLVHPIQTQAVTYIWQRSESLMGLFFFAAVYSLVRAATGGAPRFWATMTFCACLLGLGAKEVMVAVFPTLFVLDGVLLSPSFRAALARRWALYGAFAALGVGLLGLVLPQVSTSTGHVSRIDYALSQPGIVLRYLRLAFWPHPLCFDYGVEPVKGLADAWLVLVIVATLLATTVWALMKRSWIGVAGAWIFLTLAPTSSVIPINDLMVEYRMYLPLAGVTVLAVAALRWILPRDGLVTVRVLMLALCIASVRRNQDYLDHEGLWRKTAEVAPENSRAHLMLGVALTAQNRLPEAEAALLRALALKSDRVRTQSIRANLATVARRMGRKSEAVEHCRALVEVRSSAKNQAALGQSLLEARELDQAIEHFGLALQHNPSFLPALRGRAIARARNEQPGRARQDARRAVEVDPDDLTSWKLLGDLSVKVGDKPAAVDAYEHATELAPEDRDVTCKLASTYAATGKYARALALLERALAADPEMALQVSDLAVRLVRKRGPQRRSLALDISRLAVGASGRRNADVIVGLARVHVALGDVEIARTLYTEALRIGTVSAENRREYERAIAASEGE